VIDFLLIPLSQLVTYFSLLGSGYFGAFMEDKATVNSKFNCAEFQFRGGAQ
jgi:hypothetical protein